MKTKLDRPVKPERFETNQAQSFALKDLGRELLQEVAIQKSGRTAVTFVDIPQMKVVLTALRDGFTLPEHHVERPVTVSSIAGRLLFRVSGEETELTPGCAITLPPGAPHSAAAKEDSVFLVILGGEKKAAN